jgi:hypothetical protein
MGLSTAIAFAVVKFLGRMIIEQKLQKEIEDHKHDLSVRHMEIKNDIDTLYNRRRFVHEKEMEILPEAWKLLINAQEAIKIFVKRLDFSPPLSLLELPERLRALKERGLDDQQQKDVLESNDMEAAMQSIMRSKFLSRAHEAWSRYILYYKEASVFLEPEIKPLFAEAENILWEAILNKALNKPESTLRALDVIDKEIGPVVEKIESLIKKRLHFNEVTI